MTLPACRTGEFWIACDFCDTWYDGKCVQVGCLNAINYIVSTHYNSTDMTQKWN